MDGAARQQAYDRGNTIFSPDGRLYQVEYAREAVERGSPAVGVRAADGVVLAARKRLSSPLLDADSVAKIHRIDDHLAIASAGHAADARQLVDRARVAAQRHRLQYDEPAPIESVTTTLADHVQESTQTGGSRPYGAALLVAGVEPSHDDPAGANSATDGGTVGTNSAQDGDTVGQLYEVDPSGTPYGWRAVGIGDGSAAIRDSFEETVATPSREDAERSIEGAVTTAIGGLATADEDPDPDAYECLTIEPGSTVTARSRAEIATLLAETGA